MGRYKLLAFEPSSDRNFSKQRITSFYTGKQIIVSKCFRKVKINHYVEIKVKSAQLKEGNKKMGSKKIYVYQDTGLGLPRPFRKEERRQ